MNEKKIIRLLLKACYGFSTKLIKYWREIFIFLMFGGFIYLRLEFDKLNDALVAGELERMEVKLTVDKLISDISEEPPGRTRDIKLLELQAKGILVGGGRDNIKRKQGDVCQEEYTNNLNGPYQYTSWKNLKCTYEAKVEDLVTVYFEFSSDWEVLVDSIRNIYPYINLISDCDKINIKKKVICLGKNPKTKNIKSKVTTKYLLYGGDLDYFTTWANLERSIRLLSDSELAIFGVGGSVRNRTGHWTNSCNQLTFDHYRLQVSEGYTLEHDDCMVCDYTPGPIMIPVEHLQYSDLTLEQYFLDQAILKEKIWLACPDIMYFSKSKIGKLSLEKSTLLDLAKKHKIQGIVTQKAHDYDVTFSCDDIGLTCNAWNQASEILVPWCCIESVRHILRSLEYIRKEFGISYELESGSSLGAVKLGNFIPWDIDMDIGFNRRDFDLLRIGGRVADELQFNNLTLDGYEEDKYYEEGAGMFHIEYGGIFVEMLGNLRNLSQDYLPIHVNTFPTLIQMAPDLWIPTVANPGLYARGRYGPGYLYHVQSWRHVDTMQNAFEDYRPSGWQPCSDMTNQACLVHYSIIGNMQLGPYKYP